MGLCEVMFLFEGVNEIGILITSQTSFLFLASKYNPRARRCHQVQKITIDIVSNVNGPVTAQYTQKRSLVTFRIDGSDQLKSGMENNACSGNK